MPANRIDPLGSFNFEVQIPGITGPAFTEVSGLELEAAVIEYREGNDTALTVRKLPGLIKYGNITLKRGLTSNHSLWDWARQTVQGNVQRVAISIILMNDQRQAIVRWNIHNAWVCKYEGPMLNAKANDVAMESVEIAHEGFELVVA